METVYTGTCTRPELTVQGRLFGFQGDLNPTHVQWFHVLYWSHHSITVLLCMSWDDPGMATPAWVYLTIHV